MRYIMLCCLLLWGTTAMAENLSQDEAERFVDSLPEATTVGQQIQESDKAERFSVVMTPMEGQPYAPYTRGAVFMKMETPDLYRTMERIADKHGFDSVETWANVGDRVMAAFMAIEVEKMPEDTRKMAENMTPEMLNALPVNVRARIQGTIAMLEMTKKVSAEDLALMRELAPRMRQQMGG